MSTRHALPSVLRPTWFFLLVVLGAGCAAGPARMASAPMAAAPAEAAPPLERSLFARDPSGQLSEDALQTILAAPLEIDLPARVGVMPVITATDWRGPNPDYQRVPAGVAPFVKQLRKAPKFTLVTEIMPIPSGALGMETLREIAARYRLRYLLLYREVVTRKRHANAWAWGYTTGVGALFLPGQQHEVYGYIEATMFDIKNGTLLFTTRRAITGTRKSNTWGQARKLARLESRLLGTFAPELATDVQADVDRYARAALLENERKGRRAAAVEAAAVEAAAAVAVEP
jgi:rhombotail lipoprotein